jgi:hypothetical protein
MPRGMLSSRNIRPSKKPRWPNKENLNKSSKRKIILLNRSSSLSERLVKLNRELKSRKCDLKARDFFRRLRPIELQLRLQELKQQFKSHSKKL